MLAMGQLLAKVRELDTNVTKTIQLVIAASEGGRNGEATYQALESLKYIQKTLEGMME